VGAASHSRRRRVGGEPADDDAGAALDARPLGAVEVAIDARRLLDDALGAAAGAVPRLHVSTVTQGTDKIGQARRFSVP